VVTSAEADRDAAVAETHSGVVFFFGDRAHKLKKPVDLGFLDFRTVESRRIACHREVDLNRRFAPDVYLGVADVVGPDGDVCDHLVVMRRLPASRRLSSLARLGEPLVDEVRALGAQVAAIHAASPQTKVAATSAGWRAMAARWDRLLDSVDAVEPSVATAVDRIRHLAHRYVDGRTTLFDERVEAGCARDGHGDLLAADIFLLDDGARILDCLDFDEALRAGDVLADVAFLAMDLEHLGRPGLADAFVASYRGASGASWPASLEHHHRAERALVRADVSFIRAAQGDSVAAVAARSLLDLSLAHLEAGRVRLVLVCGPPGSGKSTVAASVAPCVDAELLRSDVVRHDVERDGSGADRYSDAAVHRVYAELLARAAGHLARGRNVVLDATWSSEPLRQAARGMARALSADLDVLECRVPPGVADARIAGRRAIGIDPSEATPSVAADLRARWVPWDDAVVIDTGGSIDETRSAAIAAIDLCNRGERSEPEERTHA
jgi:aminoglycoside phosphotransferase family enzyme/predicted kinase